LEREADLLKRCDLYVGLFLMVLSGIACILSYRLGLRSISNPGAGLIPFGVGGLLCLMAIGLVLKSLWGVKERREGEPAFREVAWGRVILVLCGLIGYGLTFDFLGFRLCTFFLMLLLLGVVGRQNWWMMLTISVLTVVFAHLIFVAWLGCPFPTGPFRI
jgi:putative tricarboxylic transport membrane protein